VVVVSTLPVVAASAWGFMLAVVVGKLAVVGGKLAVEVDKLAVVGGKLAVEVDKRIAVEEAHTSVAEPGERHSILEDTPDMASRFTVRRLE
jgi:RecJ-like exonuclease